MSYTFEVPNLSNNPYPIELNPGSSTFLVGANGSGKTRLASKAETQWGRRAHRISAHRSLNLDPTVPKISEEKARTGLRFGYTDAEYEDVLVYRTVHRWHKNVDTSLLNDFGFLLQTLFADQSNIALQTHNAAHAGNAGILQFTKLQRLNEIWKRILPHLTLVISGDDINAVAQDQPPYSATNMSDGERAVFYMLGQVLAAEPDSVLIFDEPELHVHRAILSRLWDEAEAARPDCAFLVITHDLEFAASRPGEKYVIRRFKAPGQWEIEKVPDNTGFGEEIATLILGSRKPILFVEGTGSSLDLAIYRACYPNWTVLPRGACENVIHAVATMGRNESLTRITCAGIVDADGYSDADMRQLAELGVSALPVSEIENLFLIPDIATAILEDEKYQGDELQEKLDALRADVLAEVARPGSIDKAVLRHCRRQIDRMLKKIDLKDVETSDNLAEIYTERASSLDITSIASEARERIENAVKNKDLPVLLANYDNKSLLSLAAKHLKNTSKREFEYWLTRAMRDPKACRLKSALNNVLPTIRAI